MIEKNVRFFIVAYMKLEYFRYLKVKYFYENSRNKCDLENVLATLMTV